jgi:hypothetical protein
MTTYVVSYDLRAPGRDYKKLFEFLESHTSWAHPLESTWVVVSGRSARQLREIARHTDANDNFLVVKSKAAWRNLTDRLTRWLQTHL